MGLDSVRPFERLSVFYRLELLEQGIPVIDFVEKALLHFAIADFEQLIVLAR